MVYIVIILIAALLGAWRYRSAAYWKWLAVLVLWIVAMEVLFSAGGTLEDSAGDGLVTHQVRVATADGPAMGLYALGVLVVHLAFLAFVFWKLYRTARTHRQALRASKVD